MSTGSQDKDLDFEIEFYEGIIKKKDDFVQALVMLGDLYTQKGRIEDGLAVDEKLVHLRPEDPYVFYNLACSYSLLNRIDEAYKAMKDAIMLGYDDFIYLERDPDLSHLRQDPRFKEYLAQAKKK